MALALENLDAPYQILGVKLLDVALIVGSLLMGALLIGFLPAIAMFSAISFLKRSIAKKPPFFLQRYFYRQLPTRSKLYGELFDSMCCSYKTRWVK